MLPRGFLGTRADVLMDVVIVSLVLILPVLAVSWRLALTRRWATHRTVQVALGSGLGVVVLLFETDLRMSGGIFELTRQSRYAGTALLNTSIWGHTVLAIGTAVLWGWMLVAALRGFGREPRPGPYSARHRLLGRIGMLAMALTGITGVELYVLGFAM